VFVITEQDEEAQQHSIDTTEEEEKTSNTNNRFKDHNYNNWYAYDIRWNLYLQLPMILQQCHNALIHQTSSRMQHPVICCTN